MKKTTYMKLLAAAMTASLLLSGCGSFRSGREAITTDSSYDGGYGYKASYSGMAEESYVDMEAEYAEDYAMEAPAAASADLSLSSGTDLNQTSVSEQKMIITWNLSMNTEHYTDVIKQIHTDITAAGGYIESESENTWSDETHYCNMVIRIPASRIDSWITGADAYGLITYRSQSQENATLSYIDMESRITSLRTEQDALLSLMNRAESMEDIITIQSQLTDVNYEIEFYESQLRTLSNTIEYATIYMDITEVSKEVPTNMSMGQEIKERFLNSIDGLGLFFRNLVVGILGNSVIIILFAGIIGAIVLITRRAIAKSKKKRMARAAAYAASIPNKETVNEADPQ